MDENLLWAAGAAEGTQESNQKSYCEHVWLHCQSNWVCYTWIMFLYNNIIQSVCCWYSRSSSNGHSRKRTALRTTAFMKPRFLNSHANSVFYIQVSVSSSCGHLVCVPMVSSYESFHCILVFFFQWAKAQIDNLRSSWTTKQVIWNHLFVSYYAGLTCLAENLMQTMDKQSAHAIKQKS